MLMNDTISKAGGYNSEFYQRRGKHLLILNR